jgi:glycine betaine/proline transport system permease protein
VTATAVDGPAVAVAAARSRAGRRVARGVAALGALVVVYRLTGDVEVPSWLDLHVRDNAQDVYGWITQNAGRNWFLDALNSIGDAISWCVDRVVGLLDALHWTGVLALTFVLGWLRAGWRAAITAAAVLFLVGLTGFWDLTMVTLAIMIVAVAMAIAVGVPLGIWSGLSERVERRLRPILDTTQVMPAFVYLIPLVSLFGIRYPGAVLATFIYAVAPAVRITNLGIRQVPEVATEVGRSFGTTTRQLLAKVQLPMARRTVLLGLNQVIMMAFGIVVIASLLGTGDVGGKVLEGLQKTDAQLSFASGFCVVFAAIALDRITTSQRAATHRAAPAWMQNRRLVWSAATVVVLAAAVAGPMLGASDFPSWRLDFGSWAESVVEWCNRNLRSGVALVGGTAAISDFLVLHVLNPVRDVLQGAAWWLVVLVAALVGWVSKGWRLAVRCALALLGVATMRNWDLAMDTLSQVLVAVVLSVVLAIPIGVWAGRSPRVEAVLRPVLDTAQVLPQFVYLVPVLFLFNVGRTPGVIASLVYALPPGIRLVSLGLREVPWAPREAALAFGATPRQELFKVQLPLALRSIMLGVNQVILMVLATVVIAGLIGGGGLGLEAASGVTKPNLKLGDGAAAGISLVLLAVVLDRVTQAWGERVEYDRRGS